MSPLKTLDIATALLVALCITASPAVQAAPNDGRYQQSLEANKRRLCADLKLILDVNEAEADKRAGTKAATQYAKNADKAWADGEKQGCSWAQ